ncbi:MAG: hypothetical protein Q9M36_06740, partial [Sulfurovum sp.]|nr:hypothetical protein [Sulfurovum sp.]
EIRRSHRARALEKERIRVNGISSNTIIPTRKIIKLLKKSHPRRIRAVRKVLKKVLIPLLKESF